MVVKDVEVVPCLLFNHHTVQKAGIYANQLDQSMNADLQYPRTQEVTEFFTWLISD